MHNVTCRGDEEINIINTSRTVKVRHGRSYRLQFIRVIALYRSFHRGVITSLPVVQRCVYRVRRDLFTRMNYESIAMAVCIPRATRRSRGARGCVVVVDSRVFDIGRICGSTVTSGVKKLQRAPQALRDGYRPDPFPNSSM